MLSRSCLVVAGLLIFGSAAEAQDGYQIIVNPANRTTSLSRPRLSKLFLEPATWEDGQAVLPVDLAAASPVRESFSKAVHGMSPAAVTARRTRMAQSGAVKAPQALATDADVIQYVRLKLGAIGYVSASADVSTVKVIAIERVPEQSTSSAAAAPERLIQGVLAAYVSALEARDLDALKRLWPTMSAGQARAIQAEFDQARTMEVELLNPRLEVMDDKAVVVARRRCEVVTTDGARLSPETGATMRFARTAAGWVIEDVRFQTEP